MTSQIVTKDQVYSQLKKCMDPEIPVNIVDLGLIYGVTVNEKNHVEITMTMTTKGCPLHNTLVSDVKRNLEKIDGIGDINVDIVWDPPWTIEKMDPQARERLGFGKPKLRFQIDYETAKPQKQGLFSKAEDGSFILINNDKKTFMVNDAIVKFWDSCDSDKNHHSISRSFLRKTRTTKTTNRTRNITVARTTF